MDTRQRLNAGEFDLTPEQRSNKTSSYERRKLVVANTDRVRISLEEEHGVTGHPKAEHLWDLAWEHGHACGYGDVVSYYEDFVKLL